MPRRNIAMHVVDTAKVAGRRQLRFASLDEVVADAERLVSSPNTKMLGNWPLRQLLSHLATAINSSIDGTFGLAPWYIRLVGPFLKRRFITKGFSAGFKLPRELEATFFPAGGSSQEALDGLRRAVGRTKNEQMTGRHPVLGKLTHDEWTQLHLRHAELHLSFALPQST
jgi:Protein of unknown function (DUF1569)